METGFEYTGEEMYAYSNERKTINRIKRLSLEFPENVKIIKEPDANQGFIYATLPSSWLKLRPPRQMSDEQREEMRQRGAMLAEMRRNQAETVDDDNDE